LACVIHVIQKQIGLASNMRFDYIESLFSI